MHQTKFFEGWYDSMGFYRHTHTHTHMYVNRIWCVQCLYGQTEFPFRKPFEVEFTIFPNGKGNFLKWKIITPIKTPASTFPFAVKIVTYVWRPSWKNRPAGCFGKCVRRPSWRKKRKGKKRASSFLFSTVRTLNVFLNNILPYIDLPPICFTFMIQLTPYHVPTNPMVGVSWHVWHGHGDGRFFK